jgi:hypothetical protein
VMAQLNLQAKLAMRYTRMVQKYFLVSNNFFTYVLCLWLLTYKTGIFSRDKENVSSPRRQGCVFKKDCE